MSATLTLSKHRLLWYLEGAARGSHLRWDIYEIFVNDVWPQLSYDEREFIYTLAKRNLSDVFSGEHADKSAKERFLQMLARFDPSNQFKVYFKTEPGEYDKERWPTMREKHPYVQCYKWNDEYRPDWRGYAPKDIIKRVEKVRYRTCDNDHCQSRLECKRFLDHHKGDDMVDAPGCIKKCEVFIDNKPNRSDSI